jgi:hypothetical protein
MSEVKPTLVYIGDLDEISPPINSWLYCFPAGKWVDAQNRSWFWLMINVVNVPSAYEYRIKFDVPIEDTTLIFPFVVKTQSNDVKKVFINGVEYQVRSKENYGDKFVVSGQEFSFKIATKHKLTRQTVPILGLEYKQAVFRSVELLNSSYIRLRYNSFEFDTVNVMRTDYIPMRNIYAIYTTSNLLTCDHITIRTSLSTFNNTNIFSAPVIANCRDTSWVRFGGIWKSCDTWMPLT